MSKFWAALVTVTSDSDVRAHVTFYLTWLLVFGAVGFRVQLVSSSLEVGMALSNSLCFPLASSVFLSSRKPLEGVLAGCQIHHVATHASFRAQLGSSCDDDNVVSRRQAIQHQVFSLGFLMSGGLADATELRTKEVPAKEDRPKFFELYDSGGVKALDIRQGNGTTPQIGDKVVIHYYARLAAKQGWRFDSTYDHKDQSGAPEPYVFVVGSGEVISGLDTAVRTMQEGGLRRIVIPPSQGYQNTTQGPIPPNYFDRQRLYTTIFNPTRLANGEGSTLGTLIFDVELLRVRPNSD